MRDILRGEDDQIAAVVEVITEINPDILLILGFDYDAGLVALNTFADLVAEQGPDYPTRFALAPNAGIPTGVDIDGDGRTPEAQDAQGYGRFRGEGGMAILSRFPVIADEVRDFSGFLWRDLPGSRAPTVLSPEALEVLRLASMGIWDVPLATGGNHVLHLLAIHATPPVFDGPEDRNGWRNHDEVGFLLRYLDGWSPDDIAAFEASYFAVMGTLNIDPFRGEGQRAALNALLGHPRIQDPQPVRRRGGLATVDWPDPTPGDLRVDYILPATGIAVRATGIHWPEDGPAADAVARASAHRMVWVDITLP